MILASVNKYDIIVSNFILIVTSILKIYCIIMRFIIIAMVGLRGIIVGGVLIYKIFRRYRWQKVNT